MNQNQLVSVIIPVYNSEKYLAECIESVLNQSYRDIEVIAINDGSTDNSLQILEKYSDRITIINQKNQGLASALNNGINTMNGRWFKWFSPDDVMYPNAIETLVNVAKDMKNTIVYSNWEMIDENSTHIRNFSESNYNDLVNSDFNIRLLDGQVININTSIIPKQIFEDGCIFQKLEDPVLIDYDFFLRAALIHQVKFHLIEKSLVKYRISKSQLSHKTISKSLTNLNILRESILDLLSLEDKKNLKQSLKDYQHIKPLNKKSIEFSLKIMKKILPENITDKILLLYLNRIRRSR